VAIPCKEQLTARVNSKFLLLVHTFSNQKSTSGWALLNISVSLSLYGKFVFCQIRLFDLPHEYDSSNSGLFAKATDLGSFFLVASKLILLVI
jgi:hypothetical protein